MGREFFVPARIHRGKAVNDYTNIEVFEFFRFV